MASSSPQPQSLNVGKQQGRGDYLKAFPCPHPGSIPDPTLPPQTKPAQTAQTDLHGVPYPPPLANAPHSLPLPSDNRLLQVSLSDARASLASEIKSVSQAIPPHKVSTKTSPPPVPGQDLCCRAHRAEPPRVPEESVPRIRPQRQRSAASSMTPYLCAPLVISGRGFWQAR
jgi:hypothetical protein